MVDCDDCDSKPTKKCLNLNYLFKKSSWCVKNNINSRVRMCKYIDQILELSTNTMVSHNIIIYLYIC